MMMMTPTTYSVQLKMNQCLLPPQYQSLMTTFDCCVAVTMTIRWKFDCCMKRYQNDDYVIVQPRYKEFDCCISGESYVAWRSPNNNDDMMTMWLLRKRRVSCGLVRSTSWQWWWQCDCCIVVTTSILQQFDCCMTMMMVMMWLLHQQISSSSGVRKYAHEMDRLGLGITWGNLPGNRRTDGWCASSERCAPAELRRRLAPWAEFVPMVSTLPVACSLSFRHIILDLPLVDRTT